LWVAVVGHGSANYHELMDFWSWLLRNIAIIASSLHNNEVMEAFFNMVLQPRSKKGN